MQREDKHVHWFWIEKKRAGGGRQGWTERETGDEELNVCPRGSNKRGEVKTKKQRRRKALKRERGWAD